MTCYNNAVPKDSSGVYARLGMVSETIYERLLSRWETLHWVDEDTNGFKHCHDVCNQSILQVIPGMYMAVAESMQLT
jgi:hypothetical protein